MIQIVQFAFIVLIPLVLVAGGLVTLFAVGALFDALDHPEEVAGRVEALFRQPLPPARTPSNDHYYRPHWQA